MKPPEPPPAPQTTARAPRQGRGRWKWIAAIVFVLGVAALFYFLPPTELTSANGPGGGGGGGRGGGGGGGRGRFGNGPTPVSFAAAERADLPIYLSALGTVTALNTITVKSRADGELMKVYFSEGQEVKQGDLLAEIDPRSYQVSLEQAEGQLARDTALLDNARRDLQRYDNAKEAVTQQQVDAAKATVGQYEGAVRADQGSVDSYRLQLSYCRITAPISGRVGLRMVDQGNLVHSSDPGIVVITQEEPIAVVFSIPEDNLPQVRRDLASGKQIPVDAYDRAMANKIATGTVLALDNQIDLTTGTVKLKAKFANEDHSLYPNQFVNVRMLTQVRSNVLLVPNAAVQLNGDARFVFVIKDDNTVERRTITTGDTEGERTIILSGLTEGEKVVTEGVDRLQPGSEVTTKSTPAPPKPETPGRRGRGGRGRKSS